MGRNKREKRGREYYIVIRKERRRRKWGRDIIL